MAQTPYFYYDEDLVDSTHTELLNQNTGVYDERTKIAAAVQPLIDGGWIGEAARAFFQSNEEYLKLLDNLMEDTLAMIQALGQSQENTLSTMQEIDGVIAS